MAKPKHLTDRAARAVASKAKHLVKDEPGLTGPSTNAATNLIISDIIVRAAARLARNSMHKGVLRGRYGADKAKAIVENRSVLSTLALYGASKIATRSVPGALVVSTGLIAKTLFDRSQSRRKAKRKGEEQLDQMASD